MHLRKISVGLYDDLYKRLKKLSTHRGEFSYLINLAIKRLLDEEEAKSETEKGLTRR